MDMKFAEQPQNILIVSQAPEMAEMVRNAVEGTATIACTDSAADGLNKIRELRPEVIILGPLSSPEMVAQVYTQVREGWISHHASLLVVEAKDAGNSYRIVGDENLTIGISGYDLAKDSTEPFRPPEQFLPRLREAIARKLKGRENHLKRAMLDPDKFCLIWEQYTGPRSF